MQRDVNTRPVKAYIRLSSGLYCGHIETHATDLQYRPTTGKVRGSVFNTLYSYCGPKLSQLHFLDVCAGSGAVGLEALSRGFASSTFIDSSAESISLIRKNAVRLSIPQELCHYIKTDACKLSFTPIQQYSVIYLDPPYDQNICAQALECMASCGWFTEEAWVVLELPRAGAFENILITAARHGFVPIKQKSFAITQLLFLKR